ncbi:hypothetical protein P5V15_011105 [Pogonomyrmex californicus]
MLTYIRIAIRLIAMEMRDILEAIRQWCLQEVWYVRKGLQNIATADTADLPPVLLPTRPKRNFTRINTCKVPRAAPDSLEVALTHKFYLKI